MDAVFNEVPMVPSGEGESPKLCSTHPWWPLSLLLQGAVLRRV